MAQARAGLRRHGSNQRFWISISRYAADEFTIIVLTNLDESHSSTLEIAARLAPLYQPALQAAPTRSTP